MKFDIHQPCAQLIPYVKHFVISENDDRQSYKVLPGTSLVMGFQYSGRLAYLDGGVDKPLATTGITGLMDAYRILKMTHVPAPCLSFFRKRGRHIFFTNPVHELFRESLSPEHLFSAAILRNTEELLAEALNDGERIKVIESLLLNHLRDMHADILVKHALQYIHQSKGTIRITELAKKLNISQSPLEKRFRRVVGASPKKFASIVRIKNVIADLNQNKQGSAAFLAGYYDQAHFIKDSKRSLQPPPTNI